MPELSGQTYSETRWLLRARERDLLRAEGPPEYCHFWPRHLPTIVYTRRARNLFRRRYWVRCWECSLKVGPYGSDSAARLVARHVETGKVPTDG